MQEELRGYKVFQEVLTNTSKLYYAQRLAQKYVLKEYTNYRFLSPENQEEAGPRLLEAERRAQAFLEHLQRVSALMRRKCRTNGLLNIPVDVFRQGVFIYKVTRMIEPCGIEPARLHSVIAQQQMDVFLRTVLTQLDLLQRMGFVHGDVKPENLLITRREKCYSAVMIDYEGGFILGSGWDGHNIEYTPEYASPEMMAFQTARSSGTADDVQDAYQKLGCAADIFSAGCVFVSFLTGSILGQCGENGPVIVPAERLRQDIPLWIPKFHPFWRMLVKEMLRYEPEERPTAAEILDALWAGEDAGLMKQLTLPLQEVQKYEFANAPIECFGGQQMRAGRSQTGPGQYAVWHLDDAWTLDQTGRASKNKILARWGRAVQTRRDYLAAILRKLNGCPSASVPLPQAELLSQGALCYLAQRLPEGDRLPVEAFAKGRHSRKETRRIMLELLDLVDRLHGIGLLGCAVTTGDIWIVTGSDGVAHPFLARPQRFLLTGQIPDPAVLDLPADILAPELCMYLGSQSAEDRQTIAKMIGTWSDIFSLGLIWHLLLCGELPSMAAPELVCLGLAAQPDETGGCGLLFSGRIDAKQQAVLRKMTAFEPDERVSSCGMAAAMLRGEEAAAAPESAAPEAPPGEKEDNSQWHPVSEEEFLDLIDLSEEDDEPEESEAIYLGGDDDEDAPELEFWD